MNRVPKILVLMASYNGEKYIKEQIESILNQKGVYVDILVSDDSSTDSTYSILEEYVNKGVIKLMKSKCGSAQKNFYNLINNCNEDYDYYALCDQDDYWMENKLKIASNMLDKYSSEQPLLYSGTSIPVDDKLNTINKKKYKHYLVNTVEKSIVASNTQGCTMVFNQKLLKKIKNKESKTALMHDSWIHKTCLVIGGKVIFDNEPHMYYRQHNNNVFAALKKEKKVIRFFKKIKFIFDNEQSEMRSELIYEWQNNFSYDLSEHTKNVFEELIESKKSIYKRLKIILSKRYKSQYKISYIKFMILTLRGKV